jgi:hypothetical protein
MPQGAALAGRPVTLFEALTNARTRAKQAEVAHAYWRLTQALGDYRAAHDAVARLSISSRAQDAAMLRAAQAAALASLQTAETLAVRCQHELGEAALLNPALPLPLPADPPHVGAYRTGFDEVYAMRGAPPQARLIHRLLPVRRRAIDVRAAAVQAAEDALQAAQDAYRQGHVELPVVLAATDEWVRQRSALLAAVCEYNHDIAEYALAVAGPQISSQTLVSMLILPSAGAAQPAGSQGTPGGSVRPMGSGPAGGGAATGSPGGVRPAAAIEPIPDDQVRFGFPSSVNVPAEAPTTFRGPAAWEQDAMSGAGKNEPTLAPPRPRAGAAQGATGGSGSATPSSATAPDGTPVPRPMERIAQRLATSPSSDPASALALFPGLAEGNLSVRAKQLSGVLHANPGELGENTQAIELAECLRSSLSADRRGLIHAYWTARQRAAQHQAVIQEIEFLDQLATTALERRSQPSGSRDMLRLRAAQLAAQAAREETLVALVRSQYELTKQAGRALESAWLRPTTAPHAGPYQLHLEARPRELAGSWTVRRLAAAVPALHETVQRRADAVIASDLTRAAATSAYQAGTRPIDSVVTAIESQTRQTLAFLEAVGDYNRAIADYVLAVVPPDLPGEQLLGTLVVVK